MKIDPLQTLTAFDGTTLCDQTGKALTLQWQIQDVLNKPLASDPWTPDTLLKCGLIAQAVYPTEVGEVELSAQDRTFIIKRSEMACGEGRGTPLQHMRLVEMLEDKPDEKPTGRAKKEN